MYWSHDLYFSNENENRFASYMSLTVESECTNNTQPFLTDHWRSRMAVQTLMVFFPCDLCPAEEGEKTSLMEGKWVKRKISKI